jgi:uncharacterized protein (DUF2225 family)
MLLCFTIHITHKKEASGWGGVRRDDENKKVFYLQNIFTYKHQQRKHEKMSHSAMH